MGEADNTGKKGGELRISDPSAWFLDHCVKTSSQLANQPTRIVLQDGDDPDDAPDVDADDAYVIDTCSYEDLQDFIEKPSKEGSTDLRRGCQFTKEVLFLHLPKQEKQDKVSGYDFLAAVVERFCLDAGADLVCLRACDLADLSEAIEPLEEGEPIQILEEDKTSNLMTKEALGEEKKNIGGSEKELEEKLEGDKEARERDGREVEGERSQVKTATAEGFREERQEYQMGDEDIGDRRGFKKEGGIDVRTGDLEDGEGKELESMDWFEGCLTALSGSETENREDQGLLNDWLAALSFFKIDRLMGQGPLADWLADWAQWKPDEGDEKEEKDMGDEGDMRDEEDEEDEEPMGNISRLVQGILQSPGVARNRKEAGATGKEIPEQEESPLVILIPDIDDFLKDDTAQMTLEHLQRGLKAKISRMGKHIIIGTNTSLPEPFSGGCNCSECREKIGKATEKFLSSATTCQICPTRSKKQQSLLEGGDLRYRLDKNIREIQKEVRRLLSAADSVPLVPYADWELPAGTEAGDLLRRRLLSSDERRKIAGRLSKDLSIDHLIKLIKRVERKIQIEKTWKDADYSKLEVPSHAAQAVRQIKGNANRFEFENRLLQCIVNPSSVRDGWDDIEIEPDTRNRVVRMIASNLRGSKSNATGLLKNAKIGGALLYGPPGTGKTHLARILAKESNAAMIHVSPADIGSKWVGETEKYIQALFNLGRMIWPCIIFIDEAESLLRSRQKSRNSWGVDQVNQFLSEADGLVRNPKNPFLVLATNYPQLLDHAILRRIPGRIYMGLPSEKGRESLFRLFLRDEHPEPIVNHEILVAKTHMYTGADIQNLCMLAAQTCVDVSAITEDTAVGVAKALTMSHFEEAFRACGPTGSKEDLAGIHSFAKQYDPSSVPAILAAMEQRMRAHHLPKQSQSPSLNAKPHQIYEEQHPVNGRSHEVDIEPTPVNYQPHEVDGKSPLINYQPPLVNGQLSQEPSTTSHHGLFSLPHQSPLQAALAAALLEKDTKAGIASISDKVSNQRLETSPDYNTSKANTLEFKTKHPSEAGSGNDMSVEVDPTLNNVRSNATASEAELADLGAPSSNVSSEADSTIDLTTSNIANEIVEGLTKQERSEIDTTSNIVKLDALKPHDSIYSALSRTDQEIRLLEIITVGNSTSRTECRLHVVHLSEAAPFTALSYVWGDQTITEEIIVNGTPHNRTKNLGNALRVVQYHWSHLCPDRHISQFRIWVDALYINQSDVVERNHQVKLMGQIYSKAELVIGHLATDDQLARLAIATLKTVHRVVKEESQKRPDVLDDKKTMCHACWVFKVPALHTLPDTDCINGTCPDRLSGGWLALKHFWALPYWQRIWIVQEVALAQKVVLVCDEDFIDVECLLELVQLFENPILGLRDHELFVEPAGLLPIEEGKWCWTTFDTLVNPYRIPCIDIRRERRRKPGDTMLFLRLCFGHPIVSATDPRDYIYGALGLWDQEFEVDYDKSVDQLIVEFFSAAVLQSFPYSFLNCWVGHHHWSTRECLAFAGVGLESFGSNSIIPSWVPPFFLSSETIDEDVPKIKGRSLFITGAIIQTIEDFHDIVSPDVSGLPDDDIFHRGMVLPDFLPGFKGLLRRYWLKRDVYITGLPIAQTLFRVLTMNNGPISTLEAFLFFKERLGPDFSDRVGSSDVKSHDPTLLGYLNEKMEEPVDWTNHEQVAKYFLEMSVSSTNSVQGCEFPVILRKFQTKQHNYYLNVGACFILGLSDSNLGEVMENMGATTERFEIC
ncbi:hypothetical protein HD806DRAFT_532827 [Xylariaceae sp. AK1471]|nr:hypothetical protein HD806DRAFT_532827 [Xylariaceae sp. AK1471]